MSVFQSIAPQIRSQKLQTFDMLYFVWGLLARLHPCDCLSVFNHAAYFYDFGVCWPKCTPHDCLLLFNNVADLARASPQLALVIYQQAPACVQIAEWQAITTE